MVETWQALWLLPLFPLVGSLLAGALHLAGVKGSGEGLARLAGPLATGAVAAGFGVAVSAFLQLTGNHELHALETTPYSWIDAGAFQVELALVADRLSSVLLLVITGVGFLIHLYSMGYMKGDPGYAKFFAYLNLFVFAMLILVLSSSLLGLFIGWEGVGLCSYLLIGFWYQKGWPAEAGQKAFVVNRIGDACFLLGSFLLISVFGTLDLSDVAAGVPNALAEHSGRLTLAALLLFGGACGKSAQFPLFTWLPDAMAGPTPVSALIHAATMVTAGVYLIVRLNPLFASNETVLMVIGIVGALTAFIGASSALRQRDIKKVLAYSTVSQLGYMFLGLSSGAFAAAIFHLVTHAFFKGLLFLGSGSVIHGMHEEQDMHKMGGLRKHMPTTYKTFLAGSAALSGLPLLSGFWSKDEILAHTFAMGGAWTVLWVAGIVTAALTAFYTWRMVALTFHGEERFDVEKVHPHESPPVMTIPLMVLAVLSIVGGFVGLPSIFHVPHLLHDWLHPVTHAGEQLFTESFGHGPHPPSHTMEWILLGLGSAIALFFAHKGFHAHKHGTGADERFAAKRPALANFLGDAWGIDSGYQRWVVQPVKLIGFGIAVFVDQFLIDGMVNGSAAWAKRLGDRARGLTSGHLAQYAIFIGGGAAALCIFWLWRAV